MKTITFLTLHPISTRKIYKLETNKLFTGTFDEV